ncbi:MAG TPA: hypothetical protein VGB64_00440 [Actinomycetota bacterium]
MKRSIALLAVLPLSLLMVSHAGASRSPAISDPAGDTFGPAPYADLLSGGFASLYDGDALIGFEFSFRTVADPATSPAPLAARASWSLGPAGDEPCWGGLWLTGSDADAWTGTIEHHCDGPDSTLVGFVLGGAQPNPVYESPVTVTRDGATTTATVMLSAFEGTPVAALYHAGQTLADTSLSIRYAGTPATGRGAGSIDGAPDVCNAEVGDGWLCQSGTPLRDERPEAAPFVLGD